MVFFFLEYSAAVSVGVGLGFLHSLLAAGAPGGSAGAGAELGMGQRCGEERCVRAARPPPVMAGCRVLESMGREEQGMKIKPGVMER